MGNLGTPELIIIILIVLLLFGGTIIKRFGKSLGDTTREIKKLKKDLKKTDDDSEEVIE